MNAWNLPAPSLKKSHPAEICCHHNPSCQGESMKYQKLLYFLQNAGRDPSSLMQEDYLTGLKNRRFLFQFLKKQVDWNVLDAHPLSLLSIDIDHFKRINDQYGSSVGDQLLVHVATILKTAAGKTGIPVLNAGDAFMLLMPDAKKHSALVLASKLIEYVRENPFFSTDAATEIPITLSIGVATAPDDAVSGRELLHQVKNALYHAKQSGRDQFADVADFSRRAVQYLDSASIAGRKFQFAQIDDALRNFKDGISQFVIIDGATGMGKTSFLDVVRRNLEKTGLNTIRVCGVMQESFRPFYLISYIAMALMNRREDRGIALLEAMDDKERNLLAYVLPQISESGPGSLEIDEQEREAVFRTFSDFFVKLADAGRLAVMIDDLDYSDPASLHLLRVVVRERALCLFICGTATKDEKASPKTIPLDLFRSAYSDGLGIQDIEMTPLGERDIEQHVRVVFPEIELPDQFVRELTDVSKGNPLFVEEILRKMINDQKIVQSGRGWKVMALEKGYFPKSVEEIIQSKINTLDGDSQRFLTCAAAFGESISLSMLTGVSDEKSAMVHDLLNRVVDKGILTSDFQNNDETVRFLSKRIQDVVYDSIHPEQKKNLHSQIGDYQEKLYQHNLLPSAAFLVHHYKRSDDPSKAEVYEEIQQQHNQAIFNDQEVTRYAVEDQAEDGTDEIGEVPLSEESLKYVPKLFQAMLVTIRNVRLYPGESKSVVNSLHQFKQLMDKLLEDVERFSIIKEKNAILINGQIIPTGNFQSIAQKIIDFWDRLQIRSLTFVRGFTAEELRRVFENICRLEPKEIKPRYWEKFKETHQLSRIFPRQIRYAKKDSEDLKQMAASETGPPHPPGANEDTDAVAADHIQQIIAALLGAYSKLKLYPAHGPVAKEAAGHVMETLGVFFRHQPLLNIARIETSLLVNGVKLDISGFETMAAGFVKFLADVKLNSITFLKKTTHEDVLAFLAAVSDATENEPDEAFWREITAKKGIQGILFDQRTYEISREQAGAHKGISEKTEKDAADLSLEMESPDFSVPPDPSPDPSPDRSTERLTERPMPASAIDSQDENAGDDSLPTRVRDLFLSGERDSAAGLLDPFCEKYKKSDEVARGEMLDVFAAMIQPADWQPGALYLKLVLGRAVPLLEEEKNEDLNRRAGEILFSGAEKFILYGDYGLGAWMFTHLRHFAGTGLSLVFEEDSAADRPLDGKLMTVVMDDLKSEDRALQQEAAQLLSSLGAWVVPLLVDTVKRESSMRVRRLAAELIRAKGDDAVNMFKKAFLTESRGEYRARILDVIDAATDDLMPVLAEALSDAADVVRRCAFRLAERLDTPQVTALLFDLARNPDAEVAVPAIHLLAKRGSEKTVPLLTEIAAQTDDKEILGAVCRVMGQIADPSFVPALENILLPRRRLFFMKKSETAIRVAAVYALSQIKDIRVAPLMKILAGDPDQRVRDAVKSLQPPA